MPEAMAGGGAYDHHSEYQMRGGASHAVVLDMMGLPDGAVAAGHDLWQHVRAVCEEMEGRGRQGAARGARRLAVESASQTGSRPLAVGHDRARRQDQ